MAEFLTPDREVGGSIPTSTVMCPSAICKDTVTPRKVLVIPRKRWLHPEMTEKLLTGMLSIITNKQTNKQTNTIYAPKSELLGFTDNQD